MMKKELSIIALSLLLGGCFSGGNNTSNSSNESSTNDSTQVASSNSIEILRDKACNELKSWGARDAHFDEDGYLVYGVLRSDLSANANDVALSMYQMVCDVPGTKGCKVVDLKTNKELGRYTK